MSILSKSNSNMGTPSFREFKKQASFFFKEKIKTARLVLTDVTPAELLTEEAVNANPSAPDMPTLIRISKAAFELDDYWRIVEILHKSLARFDRKTWRVFYNSLIVLEHLLTHGPESVSEEFQSDKKVITQAGSFQYIDEKGFNWGLAVRKKSERISKLLEKGPFLKEERDRARKLTRGIKGFGSFDQRVHSSQGEFQESSIQTYGRCNSQFNPENQENQIPDDREELTKNVKETQQIDDGHNVMQNPSKEKGNSNSRNFVNHDCALETSYSMTGLKENMAPSSTAVDKADQHKWTGGAENRPFLLDKKDQKRVILAEDDHPFNKPENKSSASLLLA